MNELNQTLESIYGPTWYEDLLKDYIHLQHYTLTQDHLPDDCKEALEKLLIVLDYLHTQKR